MHPAGTGGWLWLGVLTGSGCLVGCGPVLLPYLVSCGGDGHAPNLRRLAEFLLGRCAAYAVVAVPAVLVGERFAHAVLLNRLTGLATLGLAAALLAHTVGLVRAADRPAGGDACGACHRTRGRVPLLAGFVLGITPCPPLLLAVSALLTAGGLLHGAAFFIGFCASTSFWLLPAVGAGALGRREHWQGVSQVVVTLCGLWFAARGLAMLLQVGG